MNLICLKGRIASDIRLNTTGTGKTAVSFSVAVPRRFDRDTADFFDVVAWEKTGLFIFNYFKKGQEIALQGEMQQRKWQDKDGNNRYSFEVICEQAEFCGGKAEGENRN